MDIFHKLGFDEGQKRYGKQQPEMQNDAYDACEVCGANYGPGGTLVMQYQGHNLCTGCIQSGRWRKLANAMLDWTCSKCGAVRQASSVYDEKICPKCGALMTKPVQNAGDKCAKCGHGHDGDVCDDCDCSIFQRGK